MQRQRLGRRIPHLIALLVGASMSPAAPPTSREGLAHARALQREANLRRAEQRYHTASTALAVDGDLAVRYRGLVPVRQLRLTRGACPFEPSAITCFSLETETGPLIGPGILSFDLARFDFPRGPVRAPLEALEVYQELRHGRGWVQLLPLQRDVEARKLQVDRDDLGTGRFALAWRMRQPVNMLEVFRDPSRPGPQFVYVHGTDGTRSDYWGPRDVLSSAACFASSVHYFQYPTGRPIAENATALRDALEALPLPPSGRRVVMGFSMGGLVARYALERLGRRPAVTDLVLLATPNHGDRLLATAGTLPGLTRTHRRFLRAWPGLMDMLPGSDFLELLNAPAGPRAPRTLALVGQVDFSGDLVVGVNSAHMPRDRRPQDYRFVKRKDFLNLDRLSHWGVHQEFRVNGFEQDLLDWLGLPANPDCGLARSQARTTPFIRPTRAPDAARPAPSG